MSLETNWSLQSSRPYVSIKYGMAQLSMKTVATLVHVTVMTRIAHCQLHVSVYQNIYVMIAIFCL